MNVYLISFVGSDRYWILIREDSWNRIDDGPVTQAILDDVEAYVHEDDVEETIESLEDYSLTRNDIKMNLPPINLNGEGTYFYSIKAVHNYLLENNLTLIDETKCYI